VGEFRIEWRPVTNGQFYEYWKAAEGKVPMPKSWVMQNGNVMVSHLPKRYLFAVASCLYSFLRTPRSALYMDRFR
jgi:hypothetical protein